MGQVATGSRGVGVDGREVTVNTARLRHKSNGVGTTLVVWHVYWINGRLIASEVGAKAYAALSACWVKATMLLCVMVYSVEDGPASADPLLATFLRDNLGAIETQLRRARDGS